MFTLILGILTIVVLVYLIIQLRDHDIISVLLLLLAGGVLSAVSFIVPFLIAGDFVEREIYKETRLVSLQDSIDVKGQFFLFGGSIEGEPYYYFYKELSSGGYQLDKIEAYRVIIFEEDRDNALMVQYRNIYEKTSWSFRVAEYSKYEIYIPRGTLIRNFRLDTE